MKLEGAVPEVRTIAKQGTEAPIGAESAIRTECMSEALANGVKGGKWFSLIDKVYDRKTLKLAWKRVKTNQGAAGVDDISIERFEAKEEGYLNESETTLRGGTYRPEAVKRVCIPKGKGKSRPLGIPVV